MAKRCDMCGKGPIFGNTIQRRGLAKKKGGIGKKITGISPRRFNPNLQHVRTLVNGAFRKLKVCTRCIKSGTVVKG